MKLLFCFLLVVALSYGYDTGHHADLTRNVLHLLGYNNNAQDVAAVTNWMVDYFSYTLEKEKIIELHALHFDNLFSLQNISFYWTTLASNTRNAIKAAVAKNDHLTYLATIGASIHAVQDFYTHSTWAEMHQTVCNCYRDETWFTQLKAVNGSVLQLVNTFQSIATYSYGDGENNCEEYIQYCLPAQKEHGDYCGGVNKDSYVRPFFENSYGFGFAASYEWVYNIHNWANEEANGASVISNAKAYSPSGDDKDDLEFTVEQSVLISYATKTPFSDDGHWKGPGSGSFKRFGTSGITFLAEENIYKDLFLEKQIWKPLITPNPYHVDPAANQAYSSAVEYFQAFSEIPIADRNFTKVKVRTVKVDIPDKINTPSPYAIVTIDGQDFEEAVQIDKINFSPHWTAIKFIPATSTNIEIVYALYNDKFPRSDDQFDLADGDGKIRMTMDVFSHKLVGNGGTDLDGVYDTTATAFAVDYDGNEVSFFVTQQQYGGCVVTGFPEPFCPDEAYTYLLAYSSCGADTGLDSGASDLKNTLLFAVSRFLMSFL
eukprot:TRINITY_DN1667_c0_g1_i1.p1 TRINITY_DN1667_c0_g1~~TRINITY_DN1667_c0_g1_i1.p1  ORF type:complete len:544 (+),score=113.30 TRINITY_DN1667_c0_g1_i1:72-1703(+)